MSRIDIDVGDQDALEEMADAFSIGGDPVDDQPRDPEQARDITPEAREARSPDEEYRGLEHALEAEDVRPENPAEIGYPPTLPIEVALQTAPDDRIREAYGFTPAQWWALKRSSQFNRDLLEARSMLRTEGMSFKAKARLQSEELLATSWQMIHNANLPATVRADLLKFTIRAAGLEAKAEDKGETTTPLQINISL